MSTLIDYIIGLNIVRQKSRINQKILLFTSVFFNLAVLGFFKYYNFFIDSWIDLFHLFGYEIQSTWTLNIILPVGISFYTFQTMSYTIDIYRKKLTPTKNFISFASFVAFFPQLVAGPIERASQLLPQILKKRVFKYEQAVQGLRLMLWGMFKKIVIADQLAGPVSKIFNNYQDLDGGTLILGAIYFSFQIYCDFSGYSDIAIGTAKLFGIELMSNFKFPYFSRNIGEFWRRWHISLSTWFRDYLYIPLGGSRKGKWESIRNIFIIFIVSGFWHGAKWTFVIWGGIHAILFIPSYIFQTNRKYLSGVASNSYLPSFKEFIQIGSTFLLVTFSWIFFRSPNLDIAINYITKIGTNFQMPQDYRQPIKYILCIILMDWVFRKNEREVFFFKSKWLRKGVYILISVSIILIVYIYHFRSLEPNNQFIYFKF